ncbi:DUF6129 family protein [Pseudomaricurvus sp. HS19]|uniref:DUF6129 family protein n=1 Tax=Pseudomaricurvus sp. HS19 TaxID=2692626 RepID=UPI00136BB24E|nr:DUF6129 family protein [Pseudomaricurvus sp. HS19]MYM62506.1 hypothetical protein [Pseudomaricurvus sp. HS19]
MLNEARIDEIVSLVSQRGLDESCVAMLRQTYDDTHFTYCMDDDMNASRPFKSCEGFNVYLVSSADHCSTLTPDPELASGLVLAEVIEE